MRLSPRELVILADDYDAMVSWYVDVLGFRVVKAFSEAYHYSNLETDSGIKIGIAPASEVGVNPGNRESNTVLLQVAVPDVKQFVEKLQAHGVTVAFGPLFDKAGDFWFGAIEDVEGNPIWVVDENCP